MKKNSMPSPAILDIVTLAKKAGEAIMKIYLDAELFVEDKADQSPLTLADISANQIINEGLSILTPDWPIISEESQFPDYEIRQHWREFWLVDPLDGTKEFIHKNGEFTVNIALIEQGVPILGVVYAPAIDKCYFASKGLGAFSVQDGIKKEIHTQEGGINPVIVVSRSHIDDATKSLIDAIGHPRIISMGSSLKIGLIAEGLADLYPRLGPTMEWDTAAADAILREAGGSLCTTEGQLLDYNKPVLKNPEFLASSLKSQGRWLGYFS